MNEFLFAAVAACIMLGGALACWIAELGGQTPTSEDFDGGEDL